MVENSFLEINGDVSTDIFRPRQLYSTLVDLLILILLIFLAGLSPFLAGMCRLTST